ncbi:MAG: ABC transporter ATP-binding protein, partial [Anaerolineae bacterium]
MTKSFTPGASAVNGVGLEVAAGEIVCLLGPSGCGKTTLLRLIAGLERPDAGQVWFEGRNLAGVPPHRRGFGMMFQDFALFPHKNVFDNVAFGLQMRGDPSEQVRARVADML